MSAGKRPGGLTALAVINFVFGGFGCLGVAGMFVMLALINGSIGDDSNEQQKEMAAAWKEAGMGVFYAMVAWTAVSSGLLIASGVGYLKQHPFWGRTLGNVYSLLSVVLSVVFAMVLKESVGGGFNLGTIVGLIYPVLTLVLLNTTFKADFGGHIDS